MVPACPTYPSIAFVAPTVPWPRAEAIDLPALVADSGIEVLGFAASLREGRCRPCAVDVESTLCRRHPARHRRAGRS
jgi:hypothetical protein